MKINSICFLLAIMIGSMNALAQISAGEQSQINKLVPQPVPKSPNVAGIEKFGDYPVSYFTGLPDISIPIFEVKSGPLSVPITLSYHASGVKPTDAASWVGLGWSLSAGGQVSRNVQGKKDEEYFCSNPLISNPSVCNNYYYLQGVAQGFKDTQPDIFSYSFPGGGGKFLLTPNGGAPVFYPIAPHQLTTALSASQSTKFEITDEHGTLHRFGTNAGGTTALEYTTSTSGGNPTLNAITAWQLMDMVAPNSNDQINFSYQDIGTIDQNDQSTTIVVQDFCGGSSCPFPYLTEQTVSSVTNVNQFGLSYINSKTARVEFLTASRQDGGGQLKLLDKINIYSFSNGSYTLLKSMKFIYSYFTNSTGANLRLKLDQVQFLDNGGKVTEQYKFTYATNSFSWTNINDWKYARDLWGYYNGATQNTNLYPVTTIPFQNTTSGGGPSLTIGGAVNRNVNTQYSLEGVLTRIDFPTGGYTTFTFESNKYDNNGTPALAGGLRIAQIQSYDGTGATPKTKTYKYGNGESGLGVANFSPSQYNYQSLQNVYISANPCFASSAVTTYRSRSFSTNSAFSYNSYPVMYPYVTEYFGDVASGTIGKTVYEFDNGTPPGDIDLIIPNSAKPFRDSFDWKRGKMTHKTVFDANNNKVSESIITNYTYNASDNPVGIGAYQYNANRMPTCTDGTMPTCVNEAGEAVFQTDFFSISYTQSTGAIREVQTIEYNYQANDVNSFVASTTSKTYEPAKYFVNTVTTSGSKPTEQVVTVSKYPFQFSPTSSSTGNALGLYLLNQKNIVASPVETYTYLQNTDGSNQRLISGQVTTFRQNETNGQQVVPDKIYLWESGQTVSLSGYTPSAINGSNNGVTLDGNYKPRISMINYDAYGNLLTASKTNDVVSSYLYGYNSALPIAEATNAQNAAGAVEFFYESFEENNGSNVVSDGSVAHSGKRYLNGAYTATFVPPNGRSYVIEYWYRNGSVWQQSKVPYTGSGMVLNNGTAVDDVRIYPSDAQVKSYTYDPVLGMTSAIDASGYMKLYDYDTFGRLKRIRNEKGNIEKQFLYNYKGN